jgi:hypothetical protein
MDVRCEHNYKDTSHQVFYDGSSGEILYVNSPVFYKNDFLNPAIDEVNDVATIEETGGAAIQVLTNGYVRINTSTTPDQRNGMTGELVYEAENELIFQCKLHTTTSDAGIFLFAGLADTKDSGSGTLPITDGSLVSGTIDSETADLVGFGVRAETSDNIYAVSCKNDATPQSTDTGTDLTLATDYILEIVLDANGHARYSINGDSVVYHASAITATDPLTWYISATITTGSTAALVDVDYVLCAQNRA